MSSVTTTFRATTINQFGVRPMRRRTGWLEVKKSFRVRVAFAQGIDCRRYQYRQFIKGSASVQQGTYAGFAVLSAWRSTGPVIAVSHKIGLGINSRFQEDGQMVRGRIIRYGHNIPGTRASATTPEDRYFVDNGMSFYRATDNVGLEFPRLPQVSLWRGGPSVVRSGLRIRLNIMFQGRIVDTSRSTEPILDTQHWRVRGDLILP